MSLANPITQTDSAMSTDSTDPSTSDSRTTSISISQSDASPPSAGAPTGPSDSNISCVSCRRRKLKCDRAKPQCATCLRLRQDCEYPIRKRNVCSRRRNIKELEARLAQVERQVTSDGIQAGSLSSAKIPEDIDFSAMPMDFDAGFAMDDDSQNIPSTSANNPNDLPCGDFFSQEVISLGLEEPLPPEEITDALTRTYFDLVYPIMPHIHEYRFRAALTLPPTMRPPVYLRYAMWAVAAVRTDKYKAYADTFYRRSRRYVEVAEMKNNGEGIITVHYSQAWSLLALYEASNYYLTRAWISCGRTMRCCQMLGLDRIDNPRLVTKTILQPARDPVEIEERRRVFWAAFYCDRWAGAGTMWSMMVDEATIHTNMPCSEDEFLRGVPTESSSFADALKLKNIANMTSFGAMVLSATFFGHCHEHARRSLLEDGIDDYANGEFWERHRQMDNCLSMAFLRLPRHLRMLGNSSDPNVSFFTMNIHASIIKLHQTAIQTATDQGFDPIIIKQSRTRALLSATEIANTMRLTTQVEPARLNPWTGFWLFIAGGVLFHDVIGERQDAMSQSNHEFIVSAMTALESVHRMTTHFKTLLVLDMKNSQLSMQNGFFDVHRSDCRIYPLQREDNSQTQVQCPITNKMDGACLNETFETGSLPTRSKTQASSTSWTLRGSQQGVDRSPDTPATDQPSMAKLLDNNTWQFLGSDAKAAAQDASSRTFSMQDTSDLDIIFDTPSADPASLNNAALDSSEFLSADQNLSGFTLSDIQLDMSRPLDEISTFPLESLDGRPLTGSGACDVDLELVKEAWGNARRM